jgi:hypothetical protein
MQLALCNFDTHAEQNISLIDEMKRYKIWLRFVKDLLKIWLRLKGWVQKIFKTLLPNFVKGPYKSWLKFYSFCIVESDQNEAKG